MLLLGGETALLCPSPISDLIHPQAEGGGEGNGGEGKDQRQIVESPASKRKIKGAYTVLVHIPKYRIHVSVQFFRAAPLDLDQRVIITRLETPSIARDVRP